MGWASKDETMEEMGGAVLGADDMACGTRPPAEVFHLVQVFGIHQGEGAGFFLPGKPHGNLSSIYERLGRGEGHAVDVKLFKKGVASHS
jgi:hypothetical protein